jgi:hypothetical protein
VITDKLWSEGYLHSRRRAGSLAPVMKDGRYSADRWREWMEEVTPKACSREWLSHVRKV